MPDSTSRPPAPPPLDFARLAEQFLDHRLSQPDIAALYELPPRERDPALARRLVDLFRRNAEVMNLRRAVENRAPAGELLAIVVSALADAVRARRGDLFLAIAADGRFVVLREDGSLASERPLDALDGVAGEVFADGNSRLAGTGGDLLCVALQRKGGERVGVVQISDSAAGGFTGADLRLAETAAPVLAELAHRVILPFVGESKRAPQLVGIGGGPEDGTNRDILLSKILVVALDVLDSDRGSIYLYDPASDKLCARHAEGLGDRELRIDPGSGLVGAAFRTGELVNIVDAYQDPRFHPWLDWQIGYRTRSALCAPIFASDGRCVGVVEILNKRRGAFTGADERRIKGLASQMGVASDYARLFDQVLTIKSYNESMLRSLTNGVITVDLDRVVTFINPAASRILCIGGDDAVGRPLADIFEGFNAWVDDAIGEAGMTGDEKLLPNSEFYIAEKDDWLAANLAVVPLRDARQTALGTMLVIEDVQREREFRRTMSRYLSNDVIDRLMVVEDGGLGGSSNEVTILFSDIRGFTPLTEQLGASETVSMLNEYFSFMEDVVTNRSGIIDKYIGDAIMALFGSPFPSEHDAENAVQAASDMFQVLHLLNARRAAEGKTAIRIGVGIGTGTVVTGNIGSPKRMDFTVIGDPVNLAARIEEATKAYGADILLCGATWARLATPPRARRLDLIRLRGQTRPTELRESLAHRPDVSDAAIEVYERGLDAYLAGDWSRALRHFEENTRLLPEDRPAAVMAERCRRFLVSPPAQWDGAMDQD